MKRINRKSLLVWCVIIMGTIILMNFTGNDIYLKFYCLILAVFASWSAICIRKRLINTLLVFSLFYAILLGFGPIILYSEGFDYYKEVGNYVIISYLFFAMGYFGGGKIKIKRNKQNKLFLPSKKNPKTIYIISLAVFFVASVAYALYFARNFRTIFGADLENGRVIAMTGNGIFLWIGGLIWLAIYMVYEQRLITGKYLKSTILMFAVAASFSILLGFRSALVNPVFIVFFMKNKKKEIPVRRMILIAIALFAFVGVYGAIRGGGGSAAGSLLNEFKVSSVNLNNILYTFPRRVPYQWGSTYLLDIQALFSDVQGTTMWLKDMLGLRFSGGGVTPTLLGEFYINWGFPGVLIGMTFVGAIFRAVERSYRNPNNSYFLSCLLLGYIRPIIRGGIANSTVNLLILTIGYCACQYVAKKAKW